jgi:hypothetical protein
MGQHEAASDTTMQTGHDNGYLTRAERSNTAEGDSQQVNHEGWNQSRGTGIMNTSDEELAGSWSADADHGSVRSMGIKKPTIP